MVRATASVKNIKVTKNAAGEKQKRNHNIANKFIPTSIINGGNNHPNSKSEPIETAVVYTHSYGNLLLGLNKQGVIIHSWSDTPNAILPIATQIVHGGVEKLREKLESMNPRFIYANTNDSQIMSKGFMNNNKLFSYHSTFLDVLNSLSCSSNPNGGNNEEHNNTKQNSNIITYEDMKSLDSSITYKDYLNITKLE